MGLQKAHDRNGETFHGQAQFYRYQSEMPILPIYVLIWTGRFYRTVRQWYNQVYVIVKEIFENKRSEIGKAGKGFVSK